MRKLITKEIAGKRWVTGLTYKSSAKSVSESQFWKKIALEQQRFLHAKNRT